MSNGPHHLVSDTSNASEHLLDVAHALAKIVEGMNQLSAHVLTTTSEKLAAQFEDILDELQKSHPGFIVTRTQEEYDQAVRQTANNEWPDLDLKA